MGFEQHCIVELMGHQRVAGKVTEEEIFGTVLMRVDIPKTSVQEAFTKYYGSSAIYAITPVSEAVAQAMAERLLQRPVQVWEMPTTPALAEKVMPAYHDDPDDFDDDYEDTLYEPDEDEEDEYPYDDDSYPGSATYLRKLKTNAHEWAKALINKPYVILDLETTSLDGEPVSIAIIDHEGNTLFDKRIKPSFGDIPADATGIHGITNEMVAECPTFKEVFSEIVAVLKTDVPVIAYNADFDKRIWENTVERLELEAPNYVWECAMLQYADFYGDWNDYHGNCRWQKLAFASRIEGITFEDAHSALGDVRATRQLILKMASWNDNEDTPEVEGQKKDANVF